MTNLHEGGSEAGYCIPVGARSDEQHEVACHAAAPLWLTRGCLAASAQAAPRGHTQNVDCTGGADQQRLAGQAGQQAPPSAPPKCSRYA